MHEPETVRPNSGTAPSGDPYDILGVPSSATGDDIQAAYGQVSQRWRQRKAAATTPAARFEAEEMERRVREVRDLLLDPVKRAQFDASKPSYTGQVGLPGREAPPDTKLCPYCGEEIRRIAVKCRHCGEFLDGAPAHVAERAAPGQTVLAPIVLDGTSLDFGMLLAREGSELVLTARGGPGHVLTSSDVLTVIPAEFGPGETRLLVRVKGQPAGEHLDSRLVLGNFAEKVVVHVAASWVPPAGEQVETLTADVLARARDLDGRIAARNKGPYPPFSKQRERLGSILKDLLEALIVHVATPRGFLLPDEIEVVRALAASAKAEIDILGKSFDGEVVRLKARGQELVLEGESLQKVFTDYKSRLSVATIEAQRVVAEAREKKNGVGMGSGCLSFFVLAIIFAGAMGAGGWGLVFALIIAWAIGAGAAGSYVQNAEGMASARTASVEVPPSLREPRERWLKTVSSHLADCQAAGMDVKGLQEMRDSLT